MPPITIRPPIGGMVRRTTFQSQEPFTGYLLDNFWPIDVDTGRVALATRPAFGNAASPSTTINLIQAINGFATGKPFRSMVVAGGGNLFWWDNDKSVWFFSTGSAASTIDTGRAVYTAPFLQQVFIMQADSNPIVFDYPTGSAFVMEATAGIAPTDMRMAAVHQGALWVAGEQENPHILRASRIGNAYDWDDTVDIEDEGGAFSTGGEDEGLLNGNITALINHTSDTMVISTVEGLSVLRGHPRLGGVFENLSTNAVIQGQGAWAKTPGDNLFFLTQFGLMHLPPDPGATAQPISRELLPDELIGLTYDLSDPVVAMAYTPRYNGLYITVRGAQQQAWFYSIATGGFFQMTLAAGEHPFLFGEYKPFLTADADSVLWGKSA